MIDASWGLNNLTQEIYEIDMQIKVKVIQKLTLLLNSAKHNLVIPVLRTIGNILTGDDE